jgi:hypothetical protein
MTRVLALTTLAASVFVLPMGCGGSDAPAPASKEQFSDAITHAACDAAADCCKAPRTFDTAACTARVRSLFADALAAPLARYDAAQAGACVEETRVASKACKSPFSVGGLPGVFAPVLTPACDQVFVGTLPVGAACHGGLDCAPNGEGPGLCVNAVCALLVRGHRGDACGCQATNRGPSCDNSGTPGNNTIGNCHPEDGLACADSNDGSLASCQPLGAIGAPCLSTRFGTPCVDGGYCTSGTCARLVPIGGGCDSVDACVEAAYCDSAAGCVAKKPTGAACSDIRQCVSSSCVDGVCTDEGFATDVCSGSVL